ncbi:MAG: hypothetical protein ACYCW6_30695 [Candidatus Xenobia bacterium]
MRFLLVALPLMLLSGCTPDVPPHVAASPSGVKVAGHPGLIIPSPQEGGLPTPGSQSTTMTPVPVDVPLYPGGDLTDAKALHMESNGMTWVQDIDELHTADSVDTVVAFYSKSMNVRVRRDSKDGPHRVVTLSTSKAIDPQPGIAATWVQVEDDSGHTIVTLNTIR